MAEFSLDKKAPRPKMPHIANHKEEKLFLPIRNNILAVRKAAQLAMKKKACKEAIR
jgi:hypothetical protein